MNITFKTPSYVDVENIIFMETKKNIVMDGNFTKIIYSDNCVTLSGIYINIPLQVTQIEHNNIVSFYNTNNNIMTMKTIGELECKLLEHYKLTNGIYKNCVYNMHHQFSTGKIKLHTEHNDTKHANKKQKMKIVLKVSGIWETNNEIGVTHKMLEMYDT